MEIANFKITEFMPFLYIEMLKKCDLLNCGMLSRHLEKKILSIFFFFFFPTFVETLLV